MSMRSIGIDLGLTGAIALIDHNGLQELHDMPVMLKSGGTVKSQVNAAALAELLRKLISGHDKHEHIVLLEGVRAMPSQGSASTFSLGHTAGIVEGVVCTLDLPHQMIAPAQWKKHYGIRAEPTPKGDSAARARAKEGAKEAARTLAQRYYPHAPLARKKDHNRAETILIARYGYERHA
jgi:crossover junction endodeoxyribonuclease RuvC